MSSTDIRRVTDKGHDSQDEEGRLNMGWCSGSEIAERVWKIVDKLIPPGREKVRAARKIISVFENADCVTIDEAEELCRDAGRTYDEERDRIRYTPLPLATVPRRDFPKITITYVDGDDWEGLYLDGKLVDEGHHLGVRGVLWHLGIKSESIYAEDRWLAEQGCLPKNLENVKRG